MIIMTTSPMEWAGLSRFSSEAPGPGAMEDLALDLPKMFSEAPGLEGIPPDLFSKIFPGFLFLHPNCFPVSLCLLVTLGFLGYHWRRGKGKV